MTLKKPKSSRDSMLGAAVRGVNLLEDVDGLGSDVDARQCVAARVGDTRAQHGLIDRALRHAEAGALDGLADVELVLDRAQHGGVGRVGQEDSGEEAVARRAPGNRPADDAVVGGLLGGVVVGLAVDVGVDLRAGVAVGVVLVAEAAGPHDVGAHGSAFALDLDIGVEHISFVEAEGLRHLDVAVGVGESQLRGHGERAGGRGHIERVGQGRVQRGVRGVERERVAELLRRLLVDEVERLAVVVLVVLENPACDLAALVREGDAVEFVLDHGGRGGLCLDGGDGGLCRSGGCGRLSGSSRGRGGGRRCSVGSRLRCGLRGRVRGGRRGFLRRGLLRGEELHSEKDGEHGEHHHHERFVIAAALLTGVSELCQKILPVLTET